MPFKKPRVSLIGSCRFSGQLAMDIDWPRQLAMSFGQCPCYMAKAMKCFVFKFCGKMVQEYFSLSIEINVHGHLLVKNRINTIIKNSKVIFYIKY